MFVFTNAIINVFTGLVLGLIYGKLDTTQKSVQNRYGSLGFLTVFIGIQAVAAASTFLDQVCCRLCIVLFFVCFMFTLVRYCVHVCMFVYVCVLSLCSARY